MFVDLVVKARLFVDIGSHTGLYPLTACSANPDVRVIAFEPAPDARARLIRNVGVNRFQDRCDIRAEAISNWCGTARFQVPDHEDLASLVEDQPGGTGRIIEVRAETLDSVITAGTHVDLIKVDVEGFEEKAFLGMDRILRESHPTVIFESLTDSSGAALQALLGKYG